MTTVVNVSDARASADPREVLATYSLGSCIAVVLHDAVAGVGGMLHFQLPDSSLDSQRAQANPAMFADTGFESILRAMAGLGADKRRCKVQLAGGAQMLNDATLFNIGKRNHAAIRKILWQTGLFIDREDVGGTAPRNVYLNVADGSVTVKSHGRAAVA